MPSNSDNPRSPDLTLLAQLGEEIRSRRQQLGLDLADLEASTKVRGRYLQALEDGDYGVLPGPVYAVGFARAVASYLGLDAADFSRRYSLAIEKGPAPVVEAEAPQPKAKAPEPRREERPLPPPVEQVREPRARRAERPLRLGREAEERASAGGRARAKAPARKPWVAVLLILVLAVLTYVGYSALQLTEAPPGGDEPGGTTPGGTTPGGTTPGGTTPGGTTPGGTTPGGTTPGGTTPGGKTPQGFTMEKITTRTGSDGRLEVIVDWEKLEVELAFLDRVWLRAEGDGALTFEGTKESATTLEIKAADRVYVRLGRAKQTEVNVFGLNLGVAGPTDDARTVVVMRKQ